MTERALHVSSVNRQEVGKNSASDFIIRFKLPIELPKSQINEIALDKVSMNYSWYNITPEYDNETIRYSRDSGTNWNTVQYASGMYTYKDLDDYLQSVMKGNDHDENGIQIRFVLSTYRVEVSIAQGYQI